MYYKETNILKILPNKFYVSETNTLFLRSMSFGPMTLVWFLINLLFCFKENK